MKHFTLRKLRPLALTLGLVLCFGLLYSFVLPPYAFPGCFGKSQPQC